MKRLLIGIIVFGCTTLSASAAPLPKHLSFGVPFPPIRSDAVSTEFVAPGVTYGEYDLLADDGPITVHVVAVDLRDPTVHINTALASDRLISGGETLSSMAARTGAVAGINGDFFDIGNTNQPLNILVQSGSLLSMPRRRYALGITRDAKVEIAEFAFNASVQIGSATVGLDAVNEFPPPNDGVALLTPEFGAVKPVQSMTLVRLAPLGGTPPFARYRVTAIADNTAAQPPGYWLAIGANAYSSAGVPNIGDTIAATGNLNPPLDSLIAAVGGGPLLVHNGLPYNDPDGPGGNEFSTLIPASGAAVEADGTLLLIEVDGRQPGRSIGVTRVQLGTLMRAFGAVEGLAFDGGGSSTLVARQLGDTNADVRNSPSDGIERRIADGLLVYSNAPFGPPERLVVRPSFVRAFPGARVTMTTAVTDASGHPASIAGDVRARAVPTDLGTSTTSEFVAGSQAQNGILHFERASLFANVPVQVMDSAARIEITPAHPNLSPGERLHFHVQAFDRDGYPIALPTRAPWAASAGRIDGDGWYTAAGSDANVSVQLGRSIALDSVSVGQHEMELSLNGFRFAALPVGGPGGAKAGESCPICTTLTYDFSGTERAAYLNGLMRLPSGALGLRLDILGDGNGEVLRIAVRNAINERIAFTVGRITWKGWQSRRVRLPANLAAPATLSSIYVLSGLGSSTIHSSGQIAIRNLRVIVAGSRNTQAR